MGMGTLMAQSSYPMEIQFTTLGNCAICKTRIEAKLSLTEGVISADWDYSNDVTTVVFDDEVTDAFQIMQAIADTGHDTEWYRAPDSLYALLIGTCCEYERTIDYTNVQIGYLSLMGIWVYPVGVTETPDSREVSIYPSVGTGTLTVDPGEAAGNQESILMIYSITGRKVYHCELDLTSVNRIDLTFLVDGQYLAVISAGSEILSKAKLIITH